MSALTAKKEKIEELENPVQVFNDFYREVVKVKRSIAEGNLENEIAQQLKVARQVTEEEMAEVISTRLQRWIDKKKFNARKLLADKSYECIEKSLYIAAILADELFILEIDWPGKSYWDQVLLEERVFQTSYAGEKFYLDLKELMNQRSVDIQERGLLAVYFLAMRLGFAGLYRDQSNALKNMQRKIFKRITGDFDKNHALVCPQAYEHPFFSMEEKRLAPLSYWRRLMTYGILAYLCIGGILWFTLKGTWTAAV